MTIRTTRGIVLHIAAHRESDKLVSLYSRELGRVTGIAKGAMNSARRFVNKLEEFSLLQVGYRPPRGQAGILFLAEADLLRSHLALRQDYRRYVAAMYLCELTLRFTREGDSDPGLFALLQWALNSLDQGAPPVKTTVLFHLLLLSHAGYRPDLSRCATCRTEVGPDRTFTLLPGGGALLCSACQPLSSSRHRRLSVQTLKILDSAQTASPEWLNRLRFPERAAAEALEALQQFSHHLLQQDIHSWKAMRSCALERSSGNARNHFPTQKTGMVHA